MGGEKYYKMSIAALYYEKVGDKLKGNEAVKAYRAAQNHLQPHEEGYLENVKRLQKKIINALVE